MRNDYKRGELEELWRIEGNMLRFIKIGLEASTPVRVPEYELAIAFED